MHFFFHRKEKNGYDLLKIFERDNMIINAKMIHENTNFSVLFENIYIF